MGNLETTKYIGNWNAPNGYKHTVEDIYDCAKDSYKYRIQIKL